MSALRSKVAAVAALLIAGCGGLVVLPSTARADISYSGHAEAYGFRTTATNDALPLNFVLEGDAPVATADLSSLGDSQALAAGPYPGTTAASTPGAVGGVAGFPLPNYPVVAQATAGDDPAALSFPGLALRADAEEARASGLATLGSAAQGAESSAVVDATQTSADGVRAEATSRLEALALLDYLHFERVQSRATTVLDPSGKRISTADLRIDGITAPGLSFAMPPHTPDNIPLPNPAPGVPQPPNLKFPPLPIPGGGATYGAPELSFRNGQFFVSFTSAGVHQTSPVPFATVAQAFKAIGATVTYQAAQQTKNGIIAPTLTFVSTFPAPPQNPSGVQGPTPVTLELGRAATSVEGSAGNSLGAPAAGTTGPAGIAGVPGVPPGSPNGGAAAGLPPSLGAVGETQPAAVGKTSPAAGQGIQLAGAAGARAAGSPFTDVYAVFAVVAAVVLMAGPLATYLGARLRWSS